MVRDFLKFNSLEKQLLAAFVVLLGFMVLLYGYFIDQAVMNIAERKSLEKEIAMMNTEMGQMEHEYAILQAKITDRAAQEFGFVEAEKPVFVVREENRKFLTLNNDF